MNTKIDKTNFQFLGNDCQYRIVKLILENRDFFFQIIPILKKDVFTVPELQVIVENIIKHYNEKETIPTYKDLEYQIKTNTNTGEELINLRNALEYLTQEKLLDGIDNAGAAGLQVLRQLDMQRILKNAIKSVSDGYNSDKLNRVIEQLQNLENGHSPNTATSLEEITDLILEENPSEKVMTGLSQLDSCMYGGLSKGTVGLLIAGTGFGKTTFTSIICCNAAVFGNKKVLHIFFEDSKEDIGRKYYAHLTNRNVNAFYGKENRDALKKEIYDSYPNTKYALHNNIRLLPMENGETTIKDIENEVRKLTLKGWKPDMICIDYISCLRTTNNEVIRMQNEWQAMERMMKEIERFAKTSDTAIWVAQQTNRNGLDADTANKRMSNVQGSFRIVQPASAVLYLDRTNCDKGYANLYLDKMRGGELNAWENIRMDNGSCQIDLSIATETDVVLSTFDKKELLLN